MIRTVAGHGDQRRHHPRAAILNYPLTNPPNVGGAASTGVPIAVGIEGAGDLGAFAGIVNAAADAATAPPRLPTS